MTKSVDPMSDEAWNRRRKRSPQDNLRDLEFEKEDHFKKGQETSEMKYRLQGKRADGEMKKKKEGS